MQGSDSLAPPDPFVWDGVTGRERSEVRCTDCGEGGIPAVTVDLHNCEGSQ